MKFLLKESFIGTQPCLLMYVLHGCFHATMTDLSSCKRDCIGQQSLKYFISDIKKKLETEKYLKAKIWLFERTNKLTL